MTKYCQNETVRHIGSWLLRLHEWDARTCEFLDSSIKITFMAKNQAYKFI